LAASKEEDGYRELEVAQELEAELYFLDVDGGPFAMAATVGE